MKFLALSETGQDQACFFRTFLKEDGHTLVDMSYAEYGNSASREDLDGILATGDQAWLAGSDQKAWSLCVTSIGELVQGKGVPYLGLGLGHLAFAQAIDCEFEDLSPALNSSIEVALTEDGASGILFDGLPETFKAEQNVVKQVRVIPAYSKCLATSAEIPLQALSWETRAFGCNFTLGASEDLAERLYMNWLQTMAQS